MGENDTLLIDSFIELWANQIFNPIHPESDISFEDIHPMTKIIAEFFPLDGSEILRSDFWYF